MSKIASTRIIRTCLLLLFLISPIALPPQGASASQPQKGQIAYLRNGDIYIFDLATKQTTQITTRGDVGDFAWSPDGKQIAFAAAITDNSNIFTMSADGTTVAQVTESTLDETSPAYSRSGTLYYIQKQRLSDREPLYNAVVTRELSGKESTAYKEPGGLCTITRLSFYSDTLVALSRTCGHGASVSVIDFTTNQETPIENESCIRDAVWSNGIPLLAAIRNVCADVYVDPLPSQLPITLYSHDGRRLGFVYTPDQGYGALDWSADNRDMAYGDEKGLWLISSKGEVTQVRKEGGVPRWRPDPNIEPSGAIWMLPLGMPGAGQAQTSDFLAWGALGGCAASAAGLVIIARRRGKGGDWL